MKTNGEAIQAATNSAGRSLRSARASSVDEPGRQALPFECAGQPGGDRGLALAGALRTRRVDRLAPLA